MKIVGSDFKDFYDHLAVQTKDERPIYVRKHRGIKVSTNGSPEDLKVCKALKPYIDIFERMPNSFVFDGEELTGFCGKLYPHWDDKWRLDEVLEMVESKKFDRATSARDREWAWTKKHRESFESGPPTKIGRGHHHYRFNRADLKQFFDNFNTNIGDQPFIEIGAPIFTIYKNYDGTHVAINPCLKDMGFFKIMAAFQTYQELDMYLGNNLATQGDAKPRDITDKLRAETHGFDNWSFKTHKEDSTKAKKKKKKAEQEKERQKEEGIADAVRKALKEAKDGT